MTLPQFHKLVVERFGRDLGGMTPETAVEFVVTTREALFPSPREGKRFVLDPSAASDTYADAVRHYFAEALRLPPDQAAISLWLQALEAWACMERDWCDQRFADLLSDLEEDEDGAQST